MILQLKLAQYFDCVQPALAVSESVNSNVGTIDPPGGEMTPNPPWPMEAGSKLPLRSNRQRTVGQVPRDVQMLAYAESKP